VCGTDILKPLSGLIPRTFVDDVEYRLAVDIEYIDDNGIVEIDVVP
jgi:hypothetical protein